MLRKKKYDLLIADIKMQGNSDLQLIKKLPEFAPRMPVILVTGYPSLSSAVQSMKLPVVGYLIKPFEFSELLTVAQGAIAGKGNHLREKHLSGVINEIASDPEEVGDVHS
jgi:DNA-binding NtrC family response regulator